MVFVDDQSCAQMASGDFQFPFIDSLLQQLFDGGGHDVAAGVRMAWVAGGVNRPGADVAVKLQAGMNAIDQAAAFPQFLEEP